MHCDKKLQAVFRSACRSSPTCRSLTTVDSVITHTPRDRPRGMAYGRVWALIEAGNGSKDGHQAPREYPSSIRGPWAVLAITGSAGGALALELTLAHTNIQRPTRSLSTHVLLLSLPLPSGRPSNACTRVPTIGHQSWWSGERALTRHATPCLFLKPLRCLTIRTCMHVQYEPILLLHLESFLNATRTEQSCPLLSIDIVPSLVLPPPNVHIKY